MNGHQVSYRKPWAQGGILAQAWLGCKDSNQQEQCWAQWKGITEEYHAFLYLQGCLLYNA
jgi:hypothetical protein